MLLTFMLDVNQDVAKVDNQKNIEFFGQDLVYISLKICEKIRKFEKHYLVFKMTVLNPESHFLFIYFLYYNPI